MAHFAKIDESNVVLEVLRVNDEDASTEANGQSHLETHNNWPANLWVQTSYNTWANQHKLEGTPFRGNFACIGFTWDAANEIFWPPQPYPSWTKNNTTARWDPPVAEPEPTAEQITQMQAGTHIWNTRWDPPVAEPEPTAE